MIALPFFRQFRTMQMRYAWRHHYYWLPCPVCGVEYGGHEARYADRFELINSIPGSETGTGRIICPECTMAGYGYKHPYRYNRWGFSPNYVAEMLKSIARTRVTETWHRNTATVTTKLNQGDTEMDK